MGTRRQEKERETQRNMETNSRERTEGVMTGARAEAFIFARDRDRWKRMNSLLVPRLGKRK